jgi:acylphosphatase
VAALVRWAHRGPDGARVLRVDVSEVGATGDPGQGFERRPTA